VGIEIVKPGTPDAAPATVNTGLPSVGPTNNAALPPVVKAAAAPDAVNDIPAGTATPAAQAAPAKGKAAKPEFDKADESSSKHKKKKGIKKLDPLPQ
jgi:outer membrane protein assembly factor BamD